MLEKPRSPPKLQQNKIPRAWTCLRSWRKLAPPRSSRPWPVAVWAEVGAMIMRKHRMKSLCVHVCLTRYTRLEKVHEHPTKSAGGPDTCGSSKQSHYYSSGTRTLKQNKSLLSPVPLLVFGVSGAGMRGSGRSPLEPSLASIIGRMECGVARAGLTKRKFVEHAQGDHKRKHKSEVACHAHNP